MPWIPQPCLKLAFISLLAGYSTATAVAAPITYRFEGRLMGTGAPNHPNGDSFSGTLVYDPDLPSSQGAAYDPSLSRFYGYEYGTPVPGRSASAELEVAGRTAFTSRDSGPWNPALLAENDTRYITVESQDRVPYDALTIAFNKPNQDRLSFYFLDRTAQAFPDLSLPRELDLSDFTKVIVHHVADLDPNPKLNGAYRVSNYGLLTSLSPVPEPSSIVVFAAFGLLGVGSSAIGRKRRAGSATLRDGTCKR